MDSALFPPAPLDPTRMRTAGETGTIGQEILVLESTESTNDKALELGQSGKAEGLVVFAEHQSKGRGRRGDPWLAEPRQDLLLSVLLRPSAPLAKWGRLSHLAGLAVCRAVEAATGLCPSIKWPNDLYLGDSKLAGLLVETRASTPQQGRSFAVVGIGLNVNTTRFPSTLEVPATSLALALGAPFDRDAAASALLSEFNALYPEGLESFDKARSSIEKRSYLIGRQVRAEVGGDIHWGTVTGLGPEGELLLSSVESGDEQRLFSADKVRLTGRESDLSR